MQSPHTIVQSPHRFLTLDAMRGVAAIAVFQLHFRDMFGGVMFPHGYLAVDFFFMLSGFVLAHAYQDKLDGGWSTFSFLKARAIRLYPLYLLGLVIGMIELIVDRMLGKTSPSSGGLLVLFLLGTFELPYTFAAGSMIPNSYPFTLIFPLNLPSWSLFFEVFANIVHAVFFRRRKILLLLPVLLITGIVAAHTALIKDTLDTGSYRPVSYQGISRVLFSYTAGLLLCRVWKRARGRVLVTPLLPMGLLAAVLAARFTGHWSGPYDVLVTLLVLPLILWLGACAEPRAAFVRAFKALGDLSYAIYVLHFPLAFLIRGVWTRIHHREISLDAPWPGIVALIFTLIVAFIAHRYYDTPVRRWLGRRRLSAKAA